MNALGRMRDGSNHEDPFVIDAAIAYAVINLFTGLLAWIQYFLYHRPGTGGFISQARGSDPRRREGT